MHYANVDDEYTLYIDGEGPWPRSAFRLSCGESAFSCGGLGSTSIPLGPLDLWITPLVPGSRAASQAIVPTKDTGHVRTPITALRP